MPISECVLNELRVANCACLMSLLAVVYCQLWKSQAGPEAQQVKDSLRGPPVAHSLWS